MNESDVELAGLGWLQPLGYDLLYGPDIAPHQPGTERATYGEVILQGRLRTALRSLNPTIPAEALEDAFRKLTRPDLPSLAANNRALHRYIVDGVPVEYQHEEGFRGDLVRVVDFEEPDRNEFLAVNQFTVCSNPSSQGYAGAGSHERRADIVIFVNGLPLGVIELKSATAENADVWSAFRQVQTYKEQVPALFAHNAVLVISDGMAARVGTLTADRDRFMPWRTITGADFYPPSNPHPNPSPKGRGALSVRRGFGSSPPGRGGGEGRYGGESSSPKTELQVLLQGVFEPRRFLDLVRHFIVFEDAGAGVLVKKMAGYHQFHAVNVAVEETLRACYPNRVGAGISEDHEGYFAHAQQEAEPGDKRIGVVWHTQGSGKSLTMAFYAGRIILQPEMENPTIVVITDRNDLDDQLFDTFAKCKDLLRQPPVQAQSRADLREKLNTAGGGVIFTTIQKFMPPEDPHPNPDTLTPNPSPKERGALGEQENGAGSGSSPSGRGEGEGIPPSPSGRGEGEGILPSPPGRGAGGEGNYRGGLPRSGLLERARELRQRQTPAEDLLWGLVRNRQLGGYKFRRQHQYGLYILDLFCAEASLAVEIDGGIHDTQENKEFDAARDEYLTSKGVKVLRFKNEEVLHETGVVLEEILSTLTRMNPHPNPSPTGRGALGEQEDGGEYGFGSSPLGRGGGEGSDTDDLLPSPLGRGAGGEGPLSDRRNIVVIADEAHRSQYDFIDGFAKHMRDALPNASFIGFTGTPVELADKNTRAVFGDYISVYDIRRAVEDKATVPIYYESRLAKLALDEKERPRLDPRLEEVTEGEEPGQVEKLKSKWAQLAALVGAERRIRLVAEDLVQHFERRLEAMEGKAMVVCMSRAICVDLYNAIVALRPDWHDEDDDKGAIKIVMTGSASDPLEWQQHVRTKKGREAMAKRFKDPRDPFKVVIVRDMWLTGFDVPCLHTMYVDKPMRGHSLMQAIARVNRVFKDKPGGLVVDYLGLADDLRKAMATYTESGGTGQTTIDQDEAVMVMMEKYEICRGLFHGFGWSAWTSGTPADRLNLLPAAQEHILDQEDGKKRLLDAVSALSKAFALAVPHERAMGIRDDVGFFQAVRSVLAKETPEKRRSDEDMEHAIKQLVSQALVSDEVVDIFEAAGLKKPDISILSDEFLAEVRNMPHRNLAVELLRKLLNNEIKRRNRKNVVQARSFAQMLDEALRKYQNRAIETAQIIEELIAMAKDMREADRRGEKLGLNEDEVAFYDALETNDSAVAVLGDDTLRIIARELVETVRNNTTIDWTLRENVRAKLRVLVKRILRKYGYPPDKQEKATQTVLEQAEVLCAVEAA